MTGDTEGKDEMRACSSTSVFAFLINILFFLALKVSVSDFTGNCFVFVKKKNSQNSYLASW